MAFSIIKNWFKYHKDWDSLCNCCGKCCYVRTINEDGNLVIHYNKPCDYLDRKTNLCTVYDERFTKCENCGKVNLFRAMFSRYLPHDCPYVIAFRPWLKKKKLK